MEGEISKITVDLSSIELLDAATKQELTDMSDAIEAIDFVGLVDTLSEATVTADFTALKDALSSAAVVARDASLPATEVSLVKPRFLILSSLIHSVQFVSSHLISRYSCMLSNVPYHQES